MVDSAEVRRSSGWNVCLSPHRRREPKVLEGSTRIIRRGKSHYLVHCDGGIVDNSVDNVFVDQSHYVGLSIEAVLDDRSWLLGLPCFHFGICPSLVFCQSGIRQIKSQVFIMTVFSFPRSEANKVPG
jgi:hypothetical protein